MVTRYYRIKYKCIIFYQSNTALHVLVNVAGTCGLVIRALGIVQISVHCLKNIYIS